MKCSRCKKEIDNIPTMENSPSEYWGHTTVVFEYTLECNHCGLEHEIDSSDYYEGLDLLDYYDEDCL